MRRRYEYYIYTDTQGSEYIIVYIIYTQIPRGQVGFSQSDLENSHQVPWEVGTGSLDRLAEEELSKPMNIKSQSR